MKKVSVNFEDRVVAAADAVLAVKGHVSPLDLLIQMRLLHHGHFRQWEKGLYESLDEWIQGSPKKIAQTFGVFNDWVQRNGMIPVKATFLTLAREQAQELQVTKDANPEMEMFFRTSYASADITPRKLEALKKKLNKPPDLVVFISARDSVRCDECGVNIMSGQFLFREKKECLCLECADLGHLEFLPSGDAAMSRRAKKYSSLCALVFQFNRRNKRYQRRGILVSLQAIELAEKECLSDVEQRTASRERSAKRSVLADEQLVNDMTVLICEQYPSCPVADAQRIATHTAQRGSGRVGRSAAGRQLDATAIQLAVVAHIRHEHTKYDELLMKGSPRDEARRTIAQKINSVLKSWHKNSDNKSKGDLL